MKLLRTEKEFTDFFINNENAVIKYDADANCPDCERILPIYQRLEHASEYRHITFGMMSANSSEIARKLVAEQKLPFIAVYKNSLLVEGGTVLSEQDIRTKLEQLPTIKINL